ncbi:MAG: cyclodeaminase/cyclohydrolase family protein [Methylococcales bacterium]|nr:cyclodeaminase/cyclohydrolase family protein [Methylococcales bacterium]
MSEIKDKSIELFLDELASKSPTPGGGSVSALMGAQSAALVSMVCNLTIGKPKYVEVEAEMIDLLEKSEALREKLMALISADVCTFDQLMAAYGLPKETDEEKLHRSEMIQQALKMATQVPLDCAKACAEAIKLSRRAANNGSLVVISDAGAAVMSAFGGLKSAALNVYINTNSLKDSAFVQVTLAELDAVLKNVDVSVEEIYQTVRAKL